jgi:hypothetical protein
LRLCRASSFSVESLFQVLAGNRLRRGHDFRGRALGDDAAAEVAALGAQVDNPIGGGEQVQISA